MPQEVRAMAERGKLWYLKAFIRLDNLRTVPFRRLWLQLAAVFFLFSVIGFLVDLMVAKGQMPYAAVLAIDQVHQLLRAAKTATEVANAAQTLGQEDDISVISVTCTAALKPASA
jgi:hypothetical protein